MGDETTAEASGELRGLGENLNEVYRLLFHGRMDCDPELSVLAIWTLAIWTKRGCESVDATPNRLSVVRAEALMAEHLSEAIDMPQPVRRHGMSYSHFSRSLKRRQAWRNVSICGNCDSPMPVSYSAATR
ncbi:MAG: hypothetical protein ABI440_13865 [Casimicrobiaceae bacterium]